MIDHKHPEESPLDSYLHNPQMITLQTFEESDNKNSAVKTGTFPSPVKVNTHRAKSPKYSPDKELKLDTKNLQNKVMLTK